MVRILRSTLMVRVGGGWIALDEFLVKNDPCRGGYGCPTPGAGVQPDLQPAEPGRALTSAWEASLFPGQGTHRAVRVGGAYMGCSLLRGLAGTPSASPAHRLCCPQ